ncbi:MAG: hypothetical protein NTZ58_04865 [Solirubrobacterales bacterium]|nr:hypothetical protein [Solirubrobacterales bacterium]
MANNRQPLPRRIETWVVTGPVGHLLSAIGDWAVLLTTLARNRIKRSE